MTHKKMISVFFMSYSMCFTLLYYFFLLFSKGMSAWFFLKESTHVVWLFLLYDGIILTQYRIKFSGGDAGGATPVPFPNTVVKST